MRSCPSCRKEYQGGIQCPLCGVELHDTADRRLGSTIAGYAIEQGISSGPLATVYRASRGPEQVAIKIYGAGPHRAGQSQRIERERKVQQKLAHRCVARLIDWGDLPDGSSYLVSEWVNGTRLEDVLCAEPLGMSRIKEIIVSLAQGLDVIHAAGIVHRDLKPTNVIVPAASRSAAVILDFGNSLAIGEERLTDTGLILGSAYYMAPEQAAGQPLDARADLYALGVIVYRALTGVLPFDDPAPAEVLRKHQWEPVVPPRKRAPARDISPSAEDLCLWLLAKDREQRVPSARVLVFTLAALEPPVREPPALDEQRAL